MLYARSHFFTTSAPPEIFVESTPKLAIQRFTSESRVCDHSGLEAIDTLAERYLNAGKTLHLVHLSAECKQLLRKAGNLVEVNVIEDPKYFVAEDVLG